MSRIRIRTMRVLLAGLAAGLVCASQSAFACAACFGKSDSPLAEGMNWGIFSLLACVVGVLSGIATFGIYLARKSATTLATPASGASDEQIQKT